MRSERQTSLFSTFKESKHFGVKETKFGIIKAAAYDWKQRKKLLRSLGACKYVVAEYDKVKRIVIPAGRNHILYVTTTASLDHNKVVRKVRSFK